MTRRLPHSSAPPFNLGPLPDEDRASGINWTLINDLHKKPHPLINLVDEADYFEEIDGVRQGSPGIGEVLYEARTAQHLLDLAGIPRGRGYNSNVDARVYLLIAENIALRERLDRIEGWHSRETGPAGMVGDFCVECGNAWPCETRRMADGTHEDLATDGEPTEGSVDAHTPAASTLAAGATPGGGS